MNGEARSVDGLKKPDPFALQGSEAAAPREAWPTPVRTATARPQAGAATLAAKRAFDIAFSAGALLLLLPLMLAIALALLIADGQPVFYRQKRIGRAGRMFDCLKFRSMVKDADSALERVLSTSPQARQEWAATHKLRNDPRIHAVGRFLRRSSFDELPQFLNVLKGDMSVVGPRPITQAEAPRYGSNLADYVAVRPGITGLWQVSGRNTLSYQRRVELDSEYTNNISIINDIRIVSKTVAIVIAADGDH